MEKCSQYVLFLLVIHPKSLPFEVQSLELHILYLLSRNHSSFPKSFFKNVYNHQFLFGVCESAAVWGNLDFIQNVIGKHWSVLCGVITLTLFYFLKIILVLCEGGSKETRSKATVVFQPIDTGGFVQDGSSGGDK